LTTPSPALRIERTCCPLGCGSATRAGSFSLSGGASEEGRDDVVAPSDARESGEVVERDVRHDRQDAQEEQRKKLVPPGERFDAAAAQELFDAQGQRAAGELKRHERH